MIIYFVQAGTGGPIKIGITRNLRVRLSKMQSDCPVHLTILGSIEGSLQQELEIQRKFSSLAMDGEWFAPGRDLTSWIRQQAAVPSTPSPLRNDSIRVETVTDAIEKLGGNKMVATLTGRKPPAVSNWQAKGRFSTATYVVLSDALAKAGYRASATMWGMTDADALQVHDGMSS